MCQYSKTRPPPESTPTHSSVRLTVVTTPDMTGYTDVPFGAEMSMPLWKSKSPSPDSTPRSVGGALKIVRGSPKLPRTGCCLSNGLTGQLYEYAACLRPDALVLVTALVKATAARAVASAQTMTVRLAPRTEMCVLVSMGPRSEKLQTQPSWGANGSPTVLAAEGCLQTAERNAIASTSSAARPSPAWPPRGTRICRRPLRGGLRLAATQGLLLAGRGDADLGR